MHCHASDWARPMHSGRLTLPHGTWACRAVDTDQKCRGRPPSPYTSNLCSALPLHFQSVFSPPPTLPICVQPSPYTSNLCSALPLHFQSVFSPPPTLPICVQPSPYTSNLCSALPLHFQSVFSPPPKLPICVQPSP